MRGRLFEKSLGLLSWKNSERASEGRRGATVEPDNFRVPLLRIGVWEAACIVEAYYTDARETMSEIVNGWICSPRSLSGVD